MVTQDTQLTQHMARFPGCTVIQGDVRIGHLDCATPCTVTTFAPLGGVDTITGSLSIQCCHQLTALDGFQSLTKIFSSLRIYYNNELSTLSGFTSLEVIQGSVTIAQNRKLSHISGFTTLNAIGGYLTIERNTALTHLDGLRQLRMLRGTEVLSGHTLTVSYNANLTSLSGLAAISNISYGTVHIEGNSGLCFAGYPLWGVGSFAPRPVASDSGADKGIDWRTRLSGVEAWQFTWGVVGGGYPTLLVQNNAPTGTCCKYSRLLW